MPQGNYLADQCINLPLLTHYHRVQLVEQVFLKADFDLKLCQALFYRVGFHGVFITSRFYGAFLVAPVGVAYGPPTIDPLCMKLSNSFT